MHEELEYRTYVADLSFGVLRAYPTAYSEKDETVLSCAHIDKFFKFIFSFIFVCFLFDPFAALVSLFSFPSVVSTAVIYPELF